MMLFSSSNRALSSTSTATCLPRSHASTTDPESRLYRKSMAAPAKLCFMGHLLMEHRNSLIVDMEFTQADGHAERQAALAMLGRLPGLRLDASRAVPVAVWVFNERLRALSARLLDKEVIEGDELRELLGPTPPKDPEGTVPPALADLM